MIKRHQLKKLEKQWEAGFLPLFSDAGDTIPAQADDVDGDGAWDEIAFVLDIPARSEKELVLKPIKKEYIPMFQKRAHAFLGKSPGRNGEFIQVKEEMLPEGHLPQAQPPLYQMEGPVWENGLGAFRLYFDVRNGKDIFGKSISDIMMDSIGLPGGNYHEQQPWGMDVLKVGGSLGAGAVAFLIKDGEGQEKVYRLGSYVKGMGYKLVADGPVRAMIRLEYAGVQAGETVFDAEDEITIWAGSPGYQSKIAVSNINQPLQLVTGIVNLLASGPPVEKIGDKYVLLATHGRQSENKDFLGMALLASREGFVRFDKAPEAGAEITHTYTTVLDIAPGQPATYEFLTAWEGRDKAYADSAKFMSMVASYARKQFNPVKLRIE